jgi:hypothetical protein
VNLSAAREAEIVEELSQHLNDRYDELLIAGTGEEQTYRILMQDLKRAPTGLWAVAKPWLGGEEG